MTQLDTFSNSPKFDHTDIIYCNLELSFKFTDSPEIKIKHVLRPFSRSMEGYERMAANPRWVDMYAHTFDNNRDKFASFFADFLEARKLLAEELAAGAELESFHTKYWACDSSHRAKAKGVYELDDCTDHVAAALEVSTWVKHTMAYAG